MRRLARHHVQVDQNSVALHDDGELQDLVFCLHCHTVNSSKANRCKSCKKPLVEPLSDRRDPLERISNHNRQLKTIRISRYSDKAFDPIKEFFARLRDDINSTSISLDELIFERHLLAVLIVLVPMALILLVLVGFVLMQVK